MQLQTRNSHSGVADLGLTQGLKFCYKYEYITNISDKSLNMDSGKYCYYLYFRIVILSFLIPDMLLRKANITILKL